MKVKLTRRVLVNSVDNVQPQPVGTVVEVDDAEAKEMIANGIAEESSAKVTPEAKQAQDPANKMAPDPANKEAADTAGQAGDTERQPAAKTSRSKS